MDVAGGLSLVQTVLQLLDSAVWKETQSVLGVKSQLQKLKDSMSTIDDILRDAEQQERLHHGCPSHGDRDRLERLKEALYQADDLFDEVTTLAHLKLLMPGDKLTKEVSLFFSRFNQLRCAFTWSREIKSIRETLDDIVKDHQLAVGFRHPAVLEDSRVRNNPRETHSYVSEETDVIIGRDDDKKTLIEKLLVDTTVEEDVSVVSIVGFGGLGKTTLAELVYNDDMIQNQFPLKMWVCVSDDFNDKALVGQIILAAATNQAYQGGGLNMDQLQKNLQQVLYRNKYLLVLDDVWNENFEEWRKLKTLLVGGGRGSRIIVTTRSKKVADVVGSSWTHELKGLSDDDSWNLFQRMTLEPGKHQMEANLVDIGKEIVRKCANVPLAIRVVGSLLRGGGESRWQYFKNTDLANIKQDEIHGIVPVLKISYYYLPFHLKSCFSYCAVFPKDYKIIKEDLICLWMAQGFIMPLDGESFENAGEEYFNLLLQRCFFQDVERAKGTSDEIISCKMHDLIHDVAKEVAGTGILSSNYNRRCFSDKTRHVFIDRNTPKDLFDNFTKMRKMRSVFSVDMSVILTVRSNMLLSKVKSLKYLRVLDLSYTSKTTLLGVIGKLFQLRYLDLSNSGICLLPTSITKLYNLQTLKLRECRGLKRLPRELRKLVNLRHLDIFGCNALTHMPPGMNSMTSLHKLTGFVLSGTRDDVAGDLEYLENLSNHSDIMQIVVQKGVTHDAVEAREGGFLLKSHKLRNIRYLWDDNNNNAEALLRYLQPHSNLRKLELYSYPGVSFARWDRGLSMNLIEIKLYSCKRLEHLPLMSQLPHLKVLELENLNEVEYVESSGDVDELVFFPSLEKLILTDMRKLKGWWKSESESNSYSFPRLSHLSLRVCPNLTTFPLCPKLEELELSEFNIALGPGPISTSDALSEGQGRLWKVETDNVGYLNSLPIHSFHHLSHLQIHGDKNIERLTTGEAGEVFRSGRLSSLRSLLICYCKNLQSISGRGVWEHFTALESLQLKRLISLEMEDEDDVSDAEMPWRYLAPTLRSLGLWGLPKLEKLPKGIGGLSSLQSLIIWDCFNLESLPPSIGGLSSLQSLKIWRCSKLKSLPEEMRHLTSLTRLEIWECSTELKKRCKKPTGPDWPNIQHVPNIEIDNIIVCSREQMRLHTLGGRGSRIVVTVCSRRLAEMAGRHHTHEFRGLKFVRGFERMTLEPWQDQMEAN